MSKMFHIYENDLQKLEAALPRIMDRVFGSLNDPQLQVLFDEVKEVLSDVRWDYGPPSEVIVIETRDE